MLLLIFDNIYIMGLVRLWRLVGRRSRVKSAFFERVTK